MGIQIESVVCSEDTIFLSIRNQSYRSAQWAGHRERLLIPEENSAINDFQLSQAAGGAIKRILAQKLQLSSLG